MLELPVSPSVVLSIVVGHFQQQKCTSCMLFFVKHLFQRTEFIERNEPVLQLFPFDGNDTYRVMTLEMGFYKTSHVTRTDSGRPLDLFKRAIWHQLTFRWRDLCMSFVFFLFIYFFLHNLASSTLYLFHPSLSLSIFPHFLFLLTVQAMLVSSIFSIPLSDYPPHLSSSLPAHWDLTLGSYTWLVSMANGATCNFSGFIPFSPSRTL